MKRLSSVLFLTSMVLALTACNTVSGMGKDMQKAGEKVEEAASK